MRTRATERESMPEPATRTAGQPVRWAKLIDHDRCIGCHACTTACKSENEVPLSVTRTYVKYVEVGVFPQSRRAFQVTRCNQCERAPCATACPTGAMFRRADGIVDFDKSVCIGCKACIAACPYDAIFINPEDHSAEKCNFCAHRLDIGLEPACVVVCPVEAILIGDLNEPASRVAQTASRHPVAVRRPEKETHPKLFYRGAHQATLDPIAASRPAGGAFMWSEQETGPGKVVSGHPGSNGRPARNGRPAAGGSTEGSGNSSAAALLAYDVGHKAPWDWRVSLYTLTKGIAAGAYLSAAFLLLTGFLSAAGPLWAWAAAAVATVFLGITGGLLLWDLEHPARFYMIFTRPQWKSWLVRGAFIISGYGAVLALHLFARLAGWSGLPGPLLWLGIPLGTLTAVYTAYLFAQAKGRDLWQNPLLPPHFLVQALLAGSAALVPVAAALEPVALPALLWLLSGASLIHLLMVAGETTVTHGTAHAHLALRELTRGRYGTYFWIGTVLVALAVAAPWIGPAAAASALAGLLAFEHAYVQAGQAVPLA
jgi:Fe-S-cluster-containing dehydrogenase component/formate-dependent nitrite reductase membrane component NrfD